MNTLYLVAKVITPLTKLSVSIGGKRLKHELSRKLDGDLSHMVSLTSSYLNKFWDIYHGNYPDQPHHEPKDILKMLFNNIFVIFWLVFLSLLPRNQKDQN